MTTYPEVFLPGGFHQFNQLKKHVSFEGKTILFVGSGIEELAIICISEGADKIIIIVDDEDVLLNSRLKLAKEKNISVRLMEYDNTDFINKKFDIIYAHASVSTKKRNKILKEISNLSHSETIISIGEMVKLTEEIPTFIQDVFARSSIVPLYIEEVKNYYVERNFKVIEMRNYSPMLKSFYEKAITLFESKTSTLTEAEKSYHKKLLKKFSHEPNVYLNLGGDKHIGYISLILKSK